MQFGVQFFPDFKPEEKSARDYFRDSLDIVEAADALGYGHVRIVEHYFHYYGGNSPNPIVFLAAAAQRSKRLRLITGAVLPVFNNPLKLAGEIGMLDAISDGRCDIGIARAFLPHEFRRFGIPLDESIDRFREGLEQIDLLLRETNVTHRGTYHTIVDTTSYPRPTQRPRPRFFVASLGTPDSMEFAGREGHAVMCIPMAADKLRPAIDLYREAYRASGKPGQPEVMLAFHMYVDEDGAKAREIARPKIENYFHSIVEASSDWGSGTSSKDYPGYDKMVAKLRATTLESLIAENSAWVGTPAEIRRQIAEVREAYGEIDHASLQINFNTLPQELALGSLELFAREVMPAFRETELATR